MKRFKDYNEEYLKKLEMYVPVVERVHGPSHPEFYEVRKLYDNIVKKLNVSELDGSNLSNDFKQLQKVTDNYSVPGDVCETYEAVYNMLAQLDKDYHSK